ncbi:hypothetical protein OESDEN_20636 [Oesophagostomum dentatum]|uniref:Major facilitator superfamily (MFS) profile domain-containing protein n=1 Tax=Oesophagostomum dentatum TaxID=61180 RepID=A0A0B1S456_OESDE|nr:hypothetical protein OESDEN_20636 [Oesophagostomum dentatum]
MVNSIKISPKQHVGNSVYFVETSKKVSFDQFLVEHLGSFGRYQFLQFLLVCIPSAFVAMHVMSWTFVALQSDEICTNSTTGIDCQTIRYSAVDRWDLQGNRAWIKATVQSFYYVGHMIGALLWGITSDKIGRKRAFYIAIATQIICGALLVVAPTWWLFAVLKLGTGVAHPGIFAVGVVLGTELLGAKWRRLAAVGTGFTSGVGELILVLVAYLTYDYRIIHVVIVAPSLIFFTYWWLVPESLRWLVAKGRRDEADRILHKAARMNRSRIPDQW